MRPEFDGFAPDDTRKVKRLAVRLAAPCCQLLPVGPVGDQRRAAFSTVVEARQEVRHPALFRLGGGGETRRDGYGSSFDADIGTPPDSAACAQLPGLAT